MFRGFSDPTLLSLLISHPRYRLALIGILYNVTFLMVFETKNLYMHLFKTPMLDPIFSTTFNICQKTCISLDKQQILIGR